MSRKFLRNSCSNVSALQKVYSHLWCPSNPSTPHPSPLHQDTGIVLSRKYHSGARPLSLFGGGEGCVQMGRRVPAPLSFYNSWWPAVTVIFPFALQKMSIFSLPSQVPTPGLWFVPQPFNYKPLRFPFESGRFGFLSEHTEGQVQCLLQA